jgi:hypothetical protein
VRAWRADGGSQTSEAWIKELYTSKNKQDQNQNLPMMEKQKHRHAGPPRPPVGRRRKHQKSTQKGTTPQPLNPLQFQDHLVLETKPHFKIIIRLENAAPALLRPIVSGLVHTEGLAEGVMTLATGHTGIGSVDSRLGRVRKC